MCLFQCSLLCSSNSVFAPLLTRSPSLWCTLIFPQCFAASEGHVQN
uniref:Uncharacterized protein n=1 Tax=Anguilla anguilla TaxID=7936 RepID=A0A0E9WC44_ANGAN